MSHFTKIKTHFVSKDHLKQALADIQNEFGLGEIRENAMVRGFGGKTTPAELVVSTRNHGYDIGFRRVGEAYVLIADWYGIRDIEQARLTQKLQQRYAYHAISAQLDAQRFTVVEEEVEEDKTIRLVLRRMV